MALFGGAYFTKKWAAFLVPLGNAVRFNSIPRNHVGSLSKFCIDSCNWNDNVENKKYVAYSFLYFFRHFFIITNFGIWLSTNYYPKTGAGLAACYTASIPFFHQTLLSDLFFGITFGAYHLINKIFD
jgi:hypothetical protein